MNILRPLSKIWHLTTTYLSDIIRFTIHSNSIVKHNTLSKLEGRIIASYHVLEKGITMPNSKLIFGQDNARQLLGFLDLYVKKGYATDRLHFQSAIIILKEYVHYHEGRDEFSKDIIEKTLSLSRYVSPENNAVTGLTKVSTKQELLSKQYKDFAEFSASRLSIRNFSDVPVDLDVLNKAIDLSRHAPSACNRQPSRIYIVSDADMKKQLTALQQGNRGFGHLVDKFIVCTSELGVFDGFHERNEPFFNSGLYVMNLTYALSYYGIGSILLNWAVFADRDKALRKLLNIPSSEVITVIIGIGNYPDSLKLASSPRNPIKDFTHFV